MKNLIRKWWIWLSFAIILLGSIWGIFKTSTTDKSQITLEEYEKIKNGMTMTEVAQIINPENINEIDCEQINRLEDRTGTVVYKYKYKGKNKAYAIITYEHTQSDLWLGKGIKVLSKEQSGLK